MDSSNIEEEVLGSVTQSIESQSGDKIIPIQLRTSARVSKKLRLDSQAASSNLPQEKKEEKLDETKISPHRKYHELWAVEEKDAFFEALNEYGKDFDAIQNYMNKKRKKGTNQGLSKQRSQARNFYYRTWHKISKHLNLPQEIKKATQELYALINFGEFRKKVGSITEKNAIKFNELVYNGYTQIRIKGKTLRIKTPCCKALRKLNHLDEGTSDVKLPSRIIVELLPRDNETWSRVQSLAMNPRVRTTIPLHRRLGVLIIYLQKKWNNTESQEKGMNDNKGNEGILRLAAKAGTNISPASVAWKDTVSSPQISLLKHEENFGTAANKIMDLMKQLQSGKSNKVNKKPQVEEEKPKGYSDSEVHTSGYMDESARCGFSSPELKIFTETVNQLLTLNTEIDAANLYKDPEDEIPETTTTSKREEEDIIEKVKAGWTVENAQTTRIGDLYLMFGSDCKLKLEYWWDEEKKDNEVCNDQHKTENIISHSLRTLLSIARINQKKKEVTCSCGHVCKGQNKLAINARQRNNINKCGQNGGIEPATNTTLRDNLQLDVTPNLVKQKLSELLPKFNSRRGRKPYTRPNMSTARLIPIATKIPVQVLKPKIPVSEGIAYTTNLAHTTEPLSELILQDGISKGNSMLDRHGNLAEKENVNNSDKLLSFTSDLESFNPAFRTSDYSSDNRKVTSDNNNLKGFLEDDDDTRLSTCSSLGRLISFHFSKPPTYQSFDFQGEFPNEIEQSGTITPTKLLEENNVVPSWLLSETSNLSFTSLLEHLGTPKSISPPIDTENPTDTVDPFIENSVNYPDKLEALIAEARINC